MTQLLYVVMHFALALWVGGAFAFAAIFAPTAFRTLPSRSMAGGVTGPALAKLEVVGLVAGAFVLLGTLLLGVDAGWSGLAVLRVAFAIAMLAPITVQATTVRGRLAALREQMGQRTLDEVPEADPLRLEHAKTHRTSVMLFTLALIAGAVLVVLMALGPVAGHLPGPEPVPVPPAA